MTTEDIEPMIPKVIVKIRKKPKIVPLKELYEALSEELDDCFWSEIVEELFDRKLFENKIFELIKGSIVDYDPSKQNEKQLGDDYRIVLGWYSSIKNGRTLYKKTDSGKQLITIDDCKLLALGIFKEMIGKGFKFNHESTYKKHASELFRWLIRQIGREKVPFKKETLKLDTWPGTYDPHPKFEKALKKDWKLFFSYFSRIQKGEKLFVIPTSDFEPTEENPGKEITEAEVKSRALTLFKELIIRKKTFSRNKYKGNYKILFDWLVEQVGPQKVPWTGGGKSIKSLPFNPNHITRAELPNIDPLNCKIMSDTELVLVDRQLHRMVTPQEGSSPEIDRAHGYVLAEIKHRGLAHEPGPNAAELAFDPATIKRETLEQIDDQYIKSLTNSQLEALHSRLHELEKEMGKITEPLENAHIFVWEAMRERKLKHEIVSEMDRKSSLEVVEYPSPEEGVPQQLEKIDLEEVLKAFPDIITIDDPIHVFLCGRVVNEKGIPTSHDLDILFKQSFFHQPTMNSFLQEVSKNNPEIAKRFHFVWDADGPQIGYVVPLYKLAFIKIDQAEMQRASPYEFLSSFPQLFKPHIGIKPMSGFEKYEFWDPVELWEKWGKNFIDRGIIVQKKYDGMRFQIHCKGNEVKIFTEDRQRDRADVFKKSVQELIKDKKADAFILDAEMVEYQCGKIQSKNLEEICDALPREQMIKWIAAGAEKLDDSFIVFHVHDCTLLNGQPQNMKGYEERWNDIKKVFPDTLEHWRRVPGVKTEDPRSFASAVKKYRSLRGSEGVVCKAIDSLYKIKYSGEARSREWAKLKNLKEIDVMVSEVVQKKSKIGKILEQYLYECVFSIPCSDADKYREKDLFKKDGKCYLNIGRSYATGEKVSNGSIIVVRPIRVGEFKDPKGKLYYTWMFPYFSGKHASKTEPDGIDTVRKLVAESTGPSKKDLSKKVIFNLDTCPFWNDEKICILKERFGSPRDNLSKMTVEYLKFPIVCKYANNYKCRFVKSYYYGLKDFELASETDEDTGVDLNET